MKHEIEPPALSTSTSHASTLVVVLGMHRSGTSAATRALEAMGATFGDRLMPPQPDNPKGFFEDLDINAINVEIMRSVGVEWDALPSADLSRLPLTHLKNLQDRAFELLRCKCAAGIFALKDPRMARLLRFWKPLFDRLDARVVYIIVYRHPISVMRSLERRNTMTLAKSALLWLLYTSAAMAETVSQTRTLLNYDTLMRNPLPELRRVADELSLDFNTDLAADFSATFLDPSLRHTTFSIDDLKTERDIPLLVTELFEALCDVTERPSSETISNCNSVLSNVGRYVASSKPIFQYLWDLERSSRQLECNSLDDHERLLRLGEELRLALERLHIAEDRHCQMQFSIENAAKALQLMHSSTCWRVTAPLRWLKRSLFFSKTDHG